MGNATTAILEKCNLVGPNPTPPEQSLRIAVGIAAMEHPGVTMRIWGHTHVHTTKSSQSVACMTEPSTSSRGSTSTEQNMCGTLGLRESWVRTGDSARRVSKGLSSANIRHMQLIGSFVANNGRAPPDSRLGGASGAVVGDPPR